jgi:hypothetical protein
MAHRWTRDLTVLVVLASASATSPSALAQNVDGNHQVRFGVFGAIGPTTGTAALDTTTENYSIFSYGIGVSAGLEWVRRTDYSWGVEVDTTALGGNNTAAINEISPNLLTTVRLRGGRHIRPDLFWYGTIGAGFLSSETKYVVGTKVFQTRTGLVLGTGLEWDFRGALVTAEYLWGDFGTFNATPTGLAPHRYDADMHVFRLGLKFRVAHDHYDDDVARRIGR